MADFNYLYAVFLNINSVNNYTSKLALLRGFSTPMI